MKQIKITVGLVSVLTITLFLFQNCSKSSSIDVTSAPTNPELTPSPQDTSSSPQLEESK